MSTWNENPTAGVIGEYAGSKVAAIFSSEAAARDAAARIRQTLALADAQVQVITPADRHPGRKVEPESHGIFRTMMQSHLKLGVIGLVAGLALWFLLRALGVGFIVNTGWLTPAVLAVFGAMAGMMVGGLITLRPDHEPANRAVFEAMGEGRSAVVVHPYDAAQRDAAEAGLKELSDEVLSTL